MNASHRFASAEVIFEMDPLRLFFRYRSDDRVTPPIVVVDFASIFPSLGVQFPEMNRSQVHRSPSQISPASYCRPAWAPRRIS